MLSPNVCWCVAALDAPGLLVYSIAAMSKLRSIIPAERIERAILLDNLMLQFATSSLGWGGRRKLPLVFTEHGAVMAANVLSSPVAVAASVEVVRVFVRFRKAIAADAELARRLDALEAKFTEHDRKLVVVFDAIRKLLEPPPAPEKKGRIGFHQPSE
jgi:hypothetical protein